MGNRQRERKFARKIEFIYDNNNRVVVHVRVIITIPVAVDVVVFALLSLIKIKT